MVIGATSNLVHKETIWHITNDKGGFNGMRIIFFINLLTAIFIGLKVGGLITWSWLFVLLPTLFLLGLYIVMVIIGFITLIVVTTYDMIRGDD